MEVKTMELYELKREYEDLKNRLGDLRRSL